MQRLSSSRSFFVLVVACLIGLVGSSLNAVAQDSTPDAGEQGIEGSWVVIVAVDGGFTFPVFQTYDSDGNTTSPGLPAFAAEPGDPVETIYTSGGVGAWESTGPGTYRGTIVLMYGDVDGILLAVETVNFDVELDETGDAFTGSATFIAVDPAGATLYEGTATLTGTRITIQEPGVPVMVPVGGTPVATPAS